MAFSDTTYKTIMCYKDIKVNVWTKSNCVDVMLSKKTDNNFKYKLFSWDKMEIVNETLRYLAENIRPEWNNRDTFVYRFFCECVFSCELDRAFQVLYTKSYCSDFINWYSENKELVGVMKNEIFYYIGTLIIPIIYKVFDLYKDGKEHWEICWEMQQKKD